MGELTNNRPIARLVPFINSESTIAWPIFIPVFFPNIYSKNVSITVANISAHTITRVSLMGKNGKTNHTIGNEDTFAMITHLIFPGILTK
jgi:hypothetical protein